MYKANQAILGGFITGEVKLAIAIILLAGVDTLDLAVIFDVSPTHLYNIFKE